MSAGGTAKKKEEGTEIVRGLFVSASVYTATATPLNQVERSRGLLCKLRALIEKLRTQILDDKSESPEFRYPRLYAFRECSYRRIRP